MSWKDHKQRIYSVQKNKWDTLWHVLYGVESHKFMQETYDRVTRKTAMYIIKNMARWNKK